MPYTLSQPELDIAARLAIAGLSQPAATLAVVLVTREHARPEGELADIVRQYPGLDDRRTAQGAINELRALEWIKNTDSYDVVLAHQCPELREKIAERLNDSTVAQQLLDLRSSLEQCVSIIGSMSDRKVYETYLQLLRGAQSYILLPMLATTPKLESVPILKSRAEAGVKVCILLGSPRIVAKLRGQPMRQMAKDARKGWHDHAKGIPNMEVRVATRVDDVLLSTCMLIDGRLLRFDVYDIHRQRSLEGVMLEFAPDNDLRLNIIELFERFFSAAWSRARPLGPIRCAVWVFHQGWRWLAFIACSLLAVALAEYKTGLAIAGSAAAAFLVDAIVSSWASIRSLWRGDF